jgi:nucleoside-diphosphate-sugar epimerase
VSRELNVYSESKLLAENYILSQKATNKKIYILRPAVVVGPELKGNLKTLVQYVNSRLPWFFNSFNNSITILDLRNLSFIIKQILSEKNEIPPGIYQIGNYEPIEVRRLIKIMQVKRRMKSNLLSVPKNVIHLIFKVGDALKLPFLNLKTLDKLVLDSQISTKKISKYIPNLPFNNDETINEFL